MTPDLSVTLGRLKMKNPVTVASGTFGYGREYADLVDIAALGAVTVKGLRTDPCDGNPTPRIVEVRGGMLNAIGLQGPGIPGFIEEYMPFLREKGAPVIVNIWGATVEAYAEAAALFEGVPGVDALELNVSCPNVKQGGASFGADPALMASVVRAVRAATSLTLVTKLAPNVPDIRVFAKAAADAGSDALSICNTLPAIAIDIEARRPVLANVTGGLSGPAIHPVAVKLVWEASAAVDIPIIGMGGISEPEDAIELLAAGATAVAVGTANFIDPTTPLRVIAGIEAYLRRHGMARVSEIAIPH
ncbi:MAG: dihydroorotate dehydrogenase [Kiritimatiellia bacterium]|jgi:dihydroorotate dehydrogenase (NAD+) catalytic subunit